MPFDEEELDPHGECAAEIKRLSGALDEADALIMELMGVPFPVAYPTDSTKGTALANWKTRCVERGHG